MVKAYPQQPVYTQPPANTQQPSAPPPQYGETQFPGKILTASVIYSQKSNMVEKQFCVA